MDTKILEISRQVDTAQLTLEINPQFKSLIKHQIAYEDEYETKIEALKNIVEALLYNLKEEDDTTDGKINELIGSPIKEKLDEVFEAGVNRTSELKRILKRSTTVRRKSTPIIKPVA